MNKDLVIIGLLIVIVFFVPLTFGLAVENSMNKNKIEQLMGKYAAQEDATCITVLLLHSNTKTNSGSVLGKWTIPKYKVDDVLTDWKCWEIDY